MRRLITPFIILMLVFFAACTSGHETGKDMNVSTGEPNAEVSSSFDFSQEKIRIVTGSESGHVYPMGVQVADYLSRLGATATNTPGTAIGNLLLVQSDEMDIGHSSTAIATLASKGLKPFDEVLSDVRGIASINKVHFTFAVFDDSEINSIEEIAEKKYPLKIGIREPGSEGELVARLILESYGITYDDIREWGGRVEFGSNSDITNLLRDGHIEAGAMFGPSPASAFTEIDFQNPMRALSLSDEAVSKLNEFGFVPSSISAGTYSGQSEDAQTVAALLILVAHKDVKDEIAYEVAKYVSDVGKDDLAAIHVDYAEYLTGPEAAYSYLGLPIHPGAEQYYKEVGVMK